MFLLSTMQQRNTIFQYLLSFSFVGSRFKIYTFPGVLLLKIYGHCSKEITFEFDG